MQAGWQGDTGMSYQAWQAQWNQAMEQLVLSYRAMAGTHENNTTSMLARDQAEGAKWGGCQSTALLAGRSCCATWRVGPQRR